MMVLPAKCLLVLSVVLGWELLRIKVLPSMGGGGGGGVAGELVGLSVPKACRRGVVVLSVRLMSQDDAFFCYTKSSKN